MRKVTVAATQMKSRGFDREANIQAAEALIREAAGKGANIILIQELFQTDYFCQKMIDQNMKLALPGRRSGCKAILRTCQGTGCCASGQLL